MRILLLSSHLNTGGITSYLTTLSEGLLARGWEVHIASSWGNCSSDLQKMGVKLLPLDIHVKSIVHPKLLLSFKPLKRYIQKEKIQIVHSHTRVTQVLGELLDKGGVCAHVTTGHGYFKPKWSRQVFPCWGRRVIAISEAVKRHLVEDLNVDPEKVAVVRSGIQLDRFQAFNPVKQKALKVKFGLEGKFVVGNIARYSDVKGPDVLIHAIKNVVKDVPQVVGLLIGQGKMEEELKLLVDQLDLKQQVRFLPIVDQTDELLDVFDVFVMPSRSEGLGLSLMEAQLKGRPVIGAKVGGIMSLIEEGVDGLTFNALDAFKLAQKIERLAKDEALRSTLAFNAREKALREYSHEQMVDKIVDVYKEVLFK